MRKDSNGNNLPEPIYLKIGATAQEINQASSVNLFNLSCSIAIEKGHTVIYNEVTKSAEIIKQDGGKTSIRHT